MRAATRSLPLLAWLTGALLTTAACTGSDSDSAAYQLESQRAQLDLSGDALGGDALGSGDAYNDHYGEDARVDDGTSGDGLDMDMDPGDKDTGISVGDSASGADSWADEADTSGDEPADTAATVADTTTPGGADTASATTPADAVQADTVQADTVQADIGPEDTGSTEDTTGTGQILPPAGAKVEWCRLVYPAVVQYQQGESADVFAHVSVPGQTDITEVLPDPAPWLRGQVGWGPIGAIPSHDPSAFEWVDATPDPTPPSDLFWRYDRYVADLAVDTPGSWDYSARFSADNGATWVYCDLDGSQNGYLPDEAGRATVGE